MRYYLPLTLVVMLVLSLFSSISLSDDIFDPMDTLHVGPGQTYSTIQGAIDAADDGDTIFVHAGEYNEQVSIQMFNGLNIVGENRLTTIINSTGLQGEEDGAINILLSSYVNVSNFTIKDGYDEEFYAVFIMAEDGQGFAEYNRIFNNNIDNMYVGIYMETIEGGGPPPFQTAVAYNDVYENNISNCAMEAIVIERVEECSIYHNNIVDNMQEMPGSSQASIMDVSNIYWDDGYPSGGNYWSDFDESGEGAYDEYTGTAQTTPGADGIVDLGSPAGGLNPYYVNDFTMSDDADDYPFMNPYEWWETEDEGSEWDDTHKMHFPQLPDPYGWDVLSMWNESEPFPDMIIADDWQCSESGPVNDIHFWGSWLDDVDGELLGFAVFIYDDIPYPGLYGYSQPDEAVWQEYIGIEEVNITYMEPSPQGFLIPDEWWEHPNHVNYYRYDIENISDIVEPFIQEEGTVYWLSVIAHVSSISEGCIWGWKTSLDHWNDEGCYQYGSDPLSWYNLSDPRNGSDLDLAFVITGGGGEEPNHTYVDDDYFFGTPGWQVTHFSTLQDGVDNVLTNGTVTVYEGTYDENIVIDRSLTLFTNESVTINGVDSSASVIEVTADDVLVDGFTIDNTAGESNNYHGIAVAYMPTPHPDNCTVQNCDFDNVYWGVYIRGTNHTVHNCDIYDGNSGIMAIGSNSFDESYVITNNYVTGASAGITLQSNVNDAFIRENLIEGNSLDGISFITNCDENTIVYNNLSGNSLYGIDVGIGCDLNEIYHNNFYDNNMGSTQANDATPSTNKWNLTYPICGNYWNDHNTTDNYYGPNQDGTGSDGIVDGSSLDPYHINIGVMDYYPFVSNSNDSNATPPAGSAPLPPTNPHPANNSNTVLIGDTMEVDVSDGDGGTLTVSFYWGNGTYIANDTTASGTTASINIQDYYFMSHETNYSWYVNVTDGEYNTTSPIWNFTTCKNYDLNGDGTINYLDVSTITGHYGETVSPPGSEPWDINNDGNTNYLDISSLVGHYGESY